MRKLSLHLEREITDEQAKKLSNTAGFFSPGVLRTVGDDWTDDDLSALVCGLVAGHIDKILGDKGAFRDRWRLGK